jgi:hypothetical protein
VKIKNSTYMVINFKNIKDNSEVAVNLNKADLLQNIMRLRGNYFACFQVNYSAFSIYFYVQNL